jgi:hypothetical protein
MFAEDVKIYCEIKNVVDQNLLQSNLNKLVLWSKRNYLSLNHDKCKIITFSRTKSPVFHNYLIDNHPLERCFSISDLGICFESDMSFKINHK